MTPATATERSRGRPAPGGGGCCATSLIRFLLIFPTVFILVTVVFFLMRLTGDPITAALGGRLTPSQLEERVHAAGYDRPILVQYFEYLGNVVRGDFGRTFTDNRPCARDPADLRCRDRRAGALLADRGASPSASRSACWPRYQRDRWPDAALRVVAILGYATPVFFIGLMLKLIFSV